ncbi:hypothetical protein RVR_314 [Actinacidiphila reveromycinica]|uniref:VWFA domain-containing protein n=1 Tax=Actinacidiphila reveromycinica TaxID=659352 RepID=A0A7U3UMT2_9ACTN|nr:hypothetical protein [Streptomyces sp. SN-593]BBA95453.1 hypothetical protein RVR_314 [Streptomyces sp. SN-593]
MSEAVVLTLSRTPVPKATLAPTKARSPHVAVVYATAAGDVMCFDGRPVPSTRLWFSRYRHRYEVDLRGFSGEARVGRNPLVSSDGVHLFDVRVSFECGLNGPKGAEEWVRSGLVDALPTVHWYITGVCRGAGGGFGIEDAAGLEAELNARFAEPADIGAGLILSDVRVAVRPDARSLAFLDTLLEAERRERTGRAEHVPDLGEQRRSIELGAIRQEADIAAALQRRNAFAYLLTSAEDLVNQHLAMHPTDTAGAVEMRMRLESARAARAEQQETQAMTLLELLVNKDMILPGDLNTMRDQFLGLAGRAAGAAPPAALPGPAAAAPALPAGTTTPWAAPLGTEGTWQPAGAPGALPGAPDTRLYEPTLAAPPVTPVSAVPLTALVYLVLDESLDTPCLDELNRGLRSLHDGLSADPAVSAALRLCVVGMAGDPAVRLGLARVGPGTRTPILLRRSGLSYERAFRSLRTLLPQDVTLVRAEGARVLRPVVFLLSGGKPADGEEWQDALHGLTDEASHSSAPRIIACGLGEADPLAISRIASRPELAHMAPRPSEPVAAAHTWAVFVRDRVRDYGRRLAAGGTEFGLAGPDGFRPAGDAL